MAEPAAAPVDVSDAKPVYVHKLDAHNVQGDGTFKEVNDHDRPYEGGKEGAQNLPDLETFLEAAEVKKKEEPDNKPLEPLPEIPGYPMTVDQVRPRAPAAARAARRAPPRRRTPT
jgi:hypothetical protein